MFKRPDRSLARTRRHRRVRKTVTGTSTRPRLAVHRSARHISVQLINDETGTTLAAASTVQAAVRKSLKSTGSIDAATAVGTAIGKAAKERGVTAVVFDRGGYLYHGRVKALAEAARQAGLEF